MNEELKLGITDGIAVITLNRPDVLKQPLKYAN